MTWHVERVSSHDTQCVISVHTSCLALKPNRESNSSFCSSTTTLTTRVSLGCRRLKGQDCPIPDASHMHVFPTCCNAEVPPTLFWGLRAGWNSSLTYWASGNIVFWAAWGAVQSLDHREANKVVSNPIWLLSSGNEEIGWKSHHKKFGSHHHKLSRLARRKVLWDPNLASTPYLHPQGLWCCLQLHLCLGPTEVVDNPFCCLSHSVLCTWL